MVFEDSANTVLQPSTRDVMKARTSAFADSMSIDLEECLLLKNVFEFHFGECKVAKIILLCSYLYCNIIFFKFTFLICLQKYITETI